MLRYRAPHALLGTALLALVLDTGSARADPATSLALPWGDAVVALAQGLTSLLLPLAIAAATAAAARIAGPLRLLVTAALVERLVTNVADYAVNAVAGAARGRTLDVPIGTAVIARAVRRGHDEAPAWLMGAAGGPAGLAEKVFRSLPLDARATAANTLVPALDEALAKRTRPADPMP
ncbi:hypothetical protein ASG40_04070 [Methylobacterium sp. Leaf399]|uniref:hypothetical protein n=1 Tax=unclassified Methylobacterium TaxID=2615210 RepID=UPI0006F6E886|nr:MULTISPECIES: hypothetical protein [unclassified Methylobacterium]KQP61695.1 hypothetical protein ASF39_03240 [Methylobacterium sp. Leaf108]KQT19983.1 hypothetical protein ASG40_04070 [Methylobacterium sp. Leaf399]